MIPCCIALETEFHVTHVIKLFLVNQAGARKVTQSPTRHSNEWKLVRYLTAKSL